MTANSGSAAGQAALFIAADAAADVFGDAVAGHVGEALVASTLAQRIMEEVRRREDGLAPLLRRAPAAAAKPVTDEFWPIVSGLAL